MTKARPGKPPAGPSRRSRLDHGRHQAPAEYRADEGCLTLLIRIPVRIVVLVVVLPVRMARDALVMAARAAYRTLLRPLGRALVRLYEPVLVPLGHALMWLAAAVFVWPWVALRRYALVPGVRYGLVVPVVWLYESVLTPVGHGLRWAYRVLLAPAGRGIRRAVGRVLLVLVVLPVTGLWRYVLVPLGHGAARLVEHLVVRPLRWLYREVLTPLGHGAARLLDKPARGTAAVGTGLWTAAVWLVRTLLVTPLHWLHGRLLSPLGRGIAWLARHLVGAPVAWAYRTVCTPVGHFLRDRIRGPARRAAAEAGRVARSVLRPAGETVRRARRDAWRSLVGGAREPEPREPGRRVTRRLGTTQQTTNVPSAAPEPEISSPGEKEAERG
ncbi:hypothetical protein [Streptomyces sp. NPDC004728]|uniref:hypothetical protein n=1 Tax=Streptomyces sp. NPDC004728 TaxID=3154289 RepID=UPI0033ADF661